MSQQLSQEPVLLSVVIEGEFVRLNWLEPEFGFPDRDGGPYDIVIDGFDTDREFRTSKTTILIPIDRGTCFRVQARYVIATFDSNEICKGVPIPQPEPTPEALISIRVTYGKLFRVGTRGDPAPKIDVFLDDVFVGTAPNSGDPFLRIDKTFLVETNFGDHVVRAVITKNANCGGGSLEVIFEGEQIAFAPKNSLTLNPCGNNTAILSFTLFEVPPILPIIVEITGPETTNLNQVTTFIAKVSGGTDPLEYEWKVDGKVISNLTLIDVDFTTIGSHTVSLKITDAVNKIETTSLNVIVLPPPIPTIISVNLSSWDRTKAISIVVKGTYHFCVISFRPAFGQIRLVIQDDFGKELFRKIIRKDTVSSGCGTFTFNDSIFIRDEIPQDVNLIRVRVLVTGLDIRNSGIEIELFDIEVPTIPEPSPEPEVPTEEGLTLDQKIGLAALGIGVTIGSIIAYKFAKKK